MRAYWLHLVIGFSLLAASATPARADGVKAGLFILGVQVGNAEGVLWGLLNSYDQSVRAHPGAPPLIREHLRNAATTSKNLGLPFDGLAKLAEEVVNGKMTFAAMNAALAPLATAQSAAISGKYPVPAAAIYQLGRDRSMVGMVAEHPKNFPADKIPNYRPTIASIGAAMKTNIVVNKLEATGSLADDLVKMAAENVAYANMSSFVGGEMLRKWTDDFLKAPGWGASGPAALAIAVGPSFNFGFTAPGGKRLTYSFNGSTNTIVVRINGQTYVLGAPPGKSEMEQKLPGGGVRSTWIAQNLRFTQTLEPMAGQSGGPADTVLIRWQIENLGGGPVKVGLRTMIDTLIGSNDGVPFNVPGTGLVKTTADLRGNFPDFIQALEAPDLAKPGTIAQVTLRMRGQAEPPDRVSLTRWPGGITNWDIPVKDMGSDSALVLYWDDRDVPAGGRREIGFAYGLGRLSSSVAGSPLATTVGGRVEAGHAFTVSSYVNNPMAGETVTLHPPTGMQVIGPSTIDVPPPPAGTKTSVVSWKAKAEKPGQYQLKIASSRGSTQTQDVVIEPSTAGPIEKTIPPVAGGLLGAGIGRGAGKVDVQANGVRITAPDGTTGSGATFSKEPITGDFDVEMTFRLDSWQPRDKTLLYLRLVIVSEPREGSKSLVIVDRSAFGTTGDRYGADVFQNGSWSGRGQIVLSGDKEGRLKISRRGNMAEMSHVDASGNWRSIGNFQVALPEAVYVGVTAGNDLLPTDTAAPVAVTISNFQVNKR